MGIIRVLSSLLDWRICLLSFFLCLLGGCVLGGDRKGLPDFVHYAIR